MFVFYNIFLNREMLTFIYTSAYAFDEIIIYTNSFKYKVHKCIFFRFISNLISIHTHAWPIIFIPHQINPPHKNQSLCEPIAYILIYRL